MEYNFKLILKDLPENILEQVFEFCDDATFGWSCGIPYANFTRNADSFDEVIVLAKSDLAKCGLTVIGIENDS